MRRVIQTFENVFECYPQFVQKNLKITFLPLIRESLNSNCDIACWTPNEYQQIQHPDLYDWGFLKECDDPDFWFLDVCVDEVRQRALECLKGIEGIEARRDA